MSEESDIAAIAEAAGLGPRLHGVPERFSGQSIQPITLKAAPDLCQALAEAYPKPAGYILAPFARGQGLRIGVFGKA